jgi:hypothetical protein
MKSNRKKIIKILEKTQVDETLKLKFLRLYDIAHARGKRTMSKGS